MRHPTRRACLAAVAAPLWATPLAWAQAALPPELGDELPGVRLVGQGRLRFFGLAVYDARLWAPEPPVDDWGRVPLALELVYARDLVGKLIAERSLQEMRRQVDIAPETAERWLAAMNNLFPDVRAGDRVTGVHLPGTAARFFINGRFKGEVRDARFARHFFGIWLAPQTSEPSLRRALLGQG